MIMTKRAFVSTLDLADDASSFFTASHAAAEVT
jgi:hypothetical protein